MAGGEYSIADMAIWPWCGELTQGKFYGDAATFLGLASYKNLLRWHAEIGARPADKLA